MTSLTAHSLVCSPPTCPTPEDHPYAKLIKTVPGKLQFLLLHPNVNYEAKTTTKSKMLDFMTHFNFDHKLKTSVNKDPIVAEYKTKFLPLLLPYLAGVESPATSGGSTSTVTSENPELASRNPGETDVRMKDLSAPYVNPLAKNSTKDFLFKLISPRMKPQMIVSTMQKSDFVKLFYKFVDSAPNKPAPRSNPEYHHRPHVEISTIGLQGKERDYLRHAIQCYAPHVFIPLVVCNTTILTKLYKLFVQGNEAAGNDLCEGVHYHLISTKELNVTFAKAEAEAESETY
ncbi:hypothetical protein DFH28DRAFT_880264 [Melampsora americana]|nr:hypothetical protein DFH28DRAFT_880264 [Melampsora americana]